MTDVEDTIRASAFELVDSEGRCRAALVLSVSSEPCLDLLDANGRARLRLGVTQDGFGQLDLFDESGNVQIALGTSKDGYGLALLANGAARVRISANADSGDVVVDLCDGYGNPRVQLWVDRYGRPRAVWQQRPGERYWVNRFDPPRR